MNAFVTGELQSLWEPCHKSAKRQIELRGYRSDIGLDGFPTDPNHPFNRARYVVRACDAPAHPPLQPLSFCRTSRTLPPLFPTPTEPAISSPILRMKENMASALFGKS
jgi:hypothetical protein